MNNRLLRLASVTILLSRMKIKRPKLTKKTIPAPASGKTLVEHLDDFQSTPEDWEELEKALEKAHGNSTP